MNGDSGNASQDEHDDDQERYLEKIERLKRTENEVRILLHQIESNRIESSVLV